MRIRAAESSDLSAIAEIYNQAIRQGRVTGDIIECTLEDRQTWFREHDPSCYPIFVTDHDGQVVGYASISPYRAGRMALRFTAELSYYVDERWRRQGVASGLLESILETCQKMGYKALFAIVVEGNQGSLTLLEKYGFERWGFLPQVLDFGGVELGHVYMGMRIAPD